MRYFNKENFQEIQPKNDDNNEDEKYVLRGDFRVLNLTVPKPFEEALTSMYYRSIGGYHAAKLRRYQDLIDNFLYEELDSLRKFTPVTRNDSSVTKTLERLHVLNMLNTKIIVYPSRPKFQPVDNPHTYGPAWFVDSVMIAESAFEEIEFMKDKDFNPLREIVLDINTVSVDSIKNKLSSHSFKTNNVDTVQLVEFKSNYIKYEARTKSEQLVVFSEIYYSGNNYFNGPKGWQVYIKEKNSSNKVRIKSDHFRVNYVLRGMIVPPGEYIIEFEFEPESYKLGNTISYIFSAILITIIFILLVLRIISWVQKNSQSSAFSSSGE